ncbi:MAG: preprotein translocase subunit YajC [Dermabacter sp.]|nr:preprotein translocase subunit YajC [Dermabacter sp.]
MDPLMLLIIFFLVMMIPMWLMSRGQRKRMQQHQELLKTIGVGDEVRTHSGFYGMVVEELDDALILETESGAQLKWARQSIAERVASYGETADGQDTELSSDDAPVTDANGTISGVTVDSSDTGRDR